MCGIFGTTIKNADSKAAFTGLLHRGPDDKGEWKNDKVLLCHTRLSIIDLSSGGHQPMLNSSETIGIVFNGEIYNFNELKTSLELEGVKFKNKSDTEVILLGFEKYGDLFFQKLRGMWALAIYDSNKNKLTLSCDQFGIKSLYYSIDETGIVFGSEVKSVVPYLSKLTPNTSNYFLFYNFGYFPPGLTSFNEIKKILPGEVISFNISDGSHDHKFIDLPQIVNEEHSIKNIDEAVKLIRGGMKDSVEKHFVSDVPVGVLLSGGNDSSFLASLSKENGNKPVCFNVSIEGSLDNKYAEKVAKHLELPFESIVIKEKEFENQYKKLWDILDQPTSDVSFIPTSLVYSLIKGKSKVVLSGEGGDELFGGYLRHKSFANFNRMSFETFFPDYSSLSKLSIDFLNPILHRLRSLFSGFESVGSLYLYDAKQIDISIKQKETLEFMKNYYDNHPYKNSIQPNLFFDMFMYVPGSLMYKGDMSSMAYGIEGRTPFLDKEILSITSKIDPKLKLSNKWTSKKIMKLAMEKYLPKELIYRKKTGFGINISKYKSLVLNDLLTAIQYHIDHKEALGVVESGFLTILNKQNAELILRKYPRFAFSLISNHKVMSRYSL